MTAQNEPDPTNVPPYAGRTTAQTDEIGDDLRGTVERQLDDTKTGNPGATSSPAVESPVGGSSAGS